MKCVLSLLFLNIASPSNLGKRVSVKNLYARNMLGFFRLMVALITSFNSQPAVSFRVESVR